MSLVLLPNPNDIDYYIQSLQNRLYNQCLCNLWNVSDNTYNCFGRVYRNADKENGFIPEFYNPSLGQYVAGGNKNVKGGMFFQDTLAAMSYFYLADPIKRATNADNQATLQLLFFLDLSKITAGGYSQQQAQGQRLDEVAINDVVNFIKFNGCGFVVTNVYRNVDKVLESFSGAIKKDSLNDDMHPRLCFRIDLQLNYPSTFFNPDSALPTIPMKADISIVLFIKTSPDLSKTILMPSGKYIQQEYAPTNILTPKLASDSNGYLAGKKVFYPFTYNNQSDAVPTYDGATGAWDRTDQAISPQLGFNDGDFVAITFTDQW